MKTTLIILVLTALSLSSSILASTDLPPCKSAPEKVEVGFQCETSKGFVFERLENGWEDLQGNIWLDGVLSNKEQDQGATFCKNKGATLPTEKDFELAEDHGFREVLKEMNNEIYWSSTKNQDRNQIILSFVADRGYLIGWWEGFLLQTKCIDL